VLGGMAHAQSRMTMLLRSALSRLVDLHTLQEKAHSHIYTHEITYTRTHTRIHAHMNVVYVILKSSLYLSQKRIEKTDKKSPF